MGKYTNYRPEPGERFTDDFAIFEVEQVGFGPIVYMDVLASRDTELEEFKWFPEPLEGLMDTPLKEFQRDLEEGNLKRYDDGIDRAIKRLK